MFCPIIKGNCVSNERNGISCAFDSTGSCLITDLLCDAETCIKAMISVLWKLEQKDPEDVENNSNAMGV